MEKVRRLRFQTLSWADRERGRGGRGRRTRTTDVAFKKSKLIGEGRSYSCDVRVTRVRPRFAEGRSGSGTELEQRHMSEVLLREFDTQRCFRKWVERIQVR